MKVPNGGMWPTTAEQVLLRAGIHHGRASDSVWPELRDRFGSAEDIQRQYPRLAPLIHYRLREAGLDWPGIDAMAEAARYAWGTNQMRLHRAAEVHAALERAEVEALFLKGVGLVRFYPSAATRPMHDIDLLVRESDIERAIEVLAATGWTMSYPFSDATRRYGHAIELIHENGDELDLHWRIAPGTYARNTTTTFLTSSTRVVVAGATVAVPSPTHQLYHAISHGLAWTKIPRLQWVADAAFIVENCGEGIDWEQLLALADANLRGLVVRQALTFLAHVIVTPIPSWVLNSEGSDGRPERREAWFLRRVGPKSPLGGIPDRWYRYRRAASAYAEVATPRGFWRYLRWRWAEHGSFALTVRNKVAERFSMRFGRSWSNRGQ